MASSYPPRRVLRSANSTASGSSLGHRMSRHIAAALLVFALAQIWLVNTAINAGASPLISIVELVALVALAIPFARRTERRWHHYGQEALPSPALSRQFRDDVRRLWLLAVMLPALWIGASMIAAL